MAITLKLNSLPEVVQSFMITNSSQPCYMQQLTTSADWVPSTKGLWAVKWTPEVPNLFLVQVIGKNRTEYSTGFRATISKVPFILLGDEEYPLFPYLMTLYPGRNLDDRKHVFSYRLSRAWRSVEFAFDIICAKWRILLKTMDTRVQRNFSCQSCMHPS